MAVGPGDDASVETGEGEVDGAAPQPATASPKRRARAPWRIGEPLPATAYRPDRIARASSRSPGFWPYMSTPAA
jgi:hypothetical protein